MSVLPERLCAVLEQLPRAKPWALIIRHAEREALTEQAPYADVALTASGEHAAAELGRRLEGHELGWAATSPFLRCRRSAALIVPRSLTPQHERRLGKPGPWVVDEARGAEVFAQRGVDGVVRAQISGEQLPGFRGLVEGSRELLNAAADRLRAHGRSGVCVTHDVVLMPAISWWFDEPFGQWLEPLAGVGVWRGRSGWVLAWAGREVEIQC